MICVYHNIDAIVLEITEPDCWKSIIITNDSILYKLLITNDLILAIQHLQSDNVLLKFVSNYIVKKKGKIQHLKLTIDKLIIK